MLKFIQKPDASSDPTSQQTHALQRHRRHRPPLAPQSRWPHSPRRPLLRLSDALLALLPGPVAARPPSHPHHRQPAARRRSRAHPLRPRRVRHPAAHSLVDPRRAPRPLRHHHHPPAPQRRRLLSRRHRPPRHPPRPRPQHLRSRLPRLRPKRCYPPQPAQNDRRHRVRLPLLNRVSPSKNHADHPLRHRSRSLPRSPV